MIVSAPANAVLGQRISISVKVASPSQARTVQLQTRTQDIFGNARWTRVSAKRVKGKTRHVFRPVVNQADSQRFRAVATYTVGPAVASRPVSVKVWSWTALSVIPDYYKTNGVSDSAMLNFGMNGTQYLGWYTYGSYGSWEERFTPGRHCKRFRGDFGIQDSSDDASSAEFRITNVDTGALLYQSPTLAPGMIAHADFALPTPYRISIQATDTSVAELNAYPAIGAPELLCRNLGG